MGANQNINLKVFYIINNGLNGLRGRQLVTGNNLNACLGKGFSGFFFDALYTITMEGFFSDPVYGGNKNKVSWSMIGFPGLPAVYADKIAKWRDKAYVAAPQSIQDFS